ncbi:hypothetical protein BDV28DRAFT_25488 [Aspergillus coremiiformis]|uniref:Rhodopsin domain-containing protein n=1 Tax=Aspergillus coremiiformis TaxID=138285 RepID=A0A5N6Z331_9EURO|nr:hypothetical protein BDV28DRAFT_25488 [Aspergillus coremiiformis]
MVEDRSVEIRVVAAILFTLAAVATALRCYVRLVLVKAFGWDDAIMVLALGFFAMFSGSMVGGSLYGSGKHLDDLTDHQRTTAMKYWFLCSVAYCFSSILCKISVGIFLLRVTVSQFHRVVIYAVTALAMVFGLVFCILIIAQCTPVTHFWMRLSQTPPNGGSCIPMTVAVVGLYIFSAVSFLFDLTVGLLPIFLVRNLQMRRDLKCGVAGLLGMACIASVAVLVRMGYVETLRNPDFLCESLAGGRAGSHPLMLTPFLDATAGIEVWSNIETGLGIIAGSLATLRPLVRMIHPPLYYKHHASAPGSRTWPNSLAPRNNALPLSSLMTTEEERHQRLKENISTSTPIAMGPGMTTSSVGAEDELSDPDAIVRQEAKPSPYQINVRRDFHIMSSESPV